MEYMQIISVPLIAVVVYLLINIIKHLTKEKESFKRIIPLFAAILGAVLGVVCFYAAPNIIMAPNVFTALIYGIASGLSATGYNQIFKQINKDNATTQSNKDNNQPPNKK